MVRVVGGISSTSTESWRSDMRESPHSSRLIRMARRTGFFPSSRRDAAVVSRLQHQCDSCVK